MTGVVTRDSAQRRPSDKHRSDARNFLLIADRLSPQADRLAAVPCPILPLLRRLSAPVAAAATRRLHENRLREARSAPDPLPKRAPQSPRFRKCGPGIERGHCGDRHITPDRPAGPPGRLRQARYRGDANPSTTASAPSAASWLRSRPRPGQRSSEARFRPSSTFPPPPARPRAAPAAPPPHPIARSNQQWT